MISIYLFTFTTVDPRARASRKAFKQDTLTLYRFQYIYIYIFDSRCFSLETSPFLVKYKEFCLV